MSGGIKHPVGLKHQLQSEIGEVSSGVLSGTFLGIGTDKRDGLVFGFSVDPSSFWDTVGTPLAKLRAKRCLETHPREPPKVRVTSKPFE